MGQGSPSNLGQAMQSGAPQQAAPQQGMPAGKGGQVFQPQQGLGQGRIQVDNSQRPPGSEMDYGFRPQMGGLGQGVFDAKSQPANDPTHMQNVFDQYLKMQEGGSAPMAPQGQPPQGLGGISNAYSQFMNQQAPQPNPVFGQQPNPDAQAAQVSGVLDSYMGRDRQQPGQAMPPMGMQGTPVPPPMGMPPQVPMMPQAPNTQQIMPEDPRMQAMRNMQRTAGLSEFMRNANVKNY